MSFLKSKADNKPEEKKSGLKPLEDDDLDQVSGGSEGPGNAGEPYQGSTSFETGGFGL